MKVIPRRHAAKEVIMNLIARIAVAALPYGGVINIIPNDLPMAPRSARLWATYKL
jgi:hypothetical protein